MTEKGDLILCSSGASAKEVAARLPKNSTIAFVRTASLTYPDSVWLDEERAEYVKAGHDLTDIRELDTVAESILRRSEVVFLGGGNTFCLLSHLRQSGLDKVLVELHHAGTILIGESAGAVVMCPTIEPIRYMDEPEQAPELAEYSGLNLVPFFASPHYLRPDFKELYTKIYHAAWEKNLPFIALRDQDYIIVSNGTMELKSAT